MRSGWLDPPTAPVAKHVCRSPEATQADVLRRWHCGECDTTWRCVRGDGVTIEWMELIQSGRLGHPLGWSSKHRWWRDPKSVVIMASAAGATVASIWIVVTQWR
jgi:hypothetical protein